MALSKVALTLIEFALDSNPKNAPGMKYCDVVIGPFDNANWYQPDCAASTKQFATPAVSWHTPPGTGVAVEKPLEFVATL